MVIHCSKICEVQWERNIVQTGTQEINTKFWWRNHFQGIHYEDKSKYGKTLSYLSPLFLFFIFSAMITNSFTHNSYKIES